MWTSLEPSRGNLVWGLGWADRYANTINSLFNRGHWERGHLHLPGDQRRWWHLYENLRMEAQRGRG
jgi:hypothetical protein